MNRTNSASIRFLSIWHIVSAALLIVGAFLFIALPLRSELIDFQVYQAAFEAYRQGENPYHHNYEFHAAFGEGQEEYPFLYPPTFLLFMAPLVYIPAQWLPSVWVTLSYASLVACVVLWVRMAKESGVELSTQKLFPLFLFLTFSFEPNFAGALEGQINSFILLLIFVAASSCHKVWICSFALLGSALLKGTPILLCLAAPFARRVQLAKRLALLGVGLMVLLFLVPFRGLFFDYLSLAGASPADLSHAQTSGNLSPLQVFRVWGKPAWLPGAYTWWKSFLALGVFLGDLYFYKRRTYFSDVLGVLVIGTVFLPPIVWFHHLTWLLFPLSLLFNRALAESDKELRIQRLVGVGIPYFLLSKAMTVVHLGYQTNYKVVTTVALLIPLLASVFVVLKLLSVKQLPVPE